MRQGDRASPFNNVVIRIKHYVKNLKDTNRGKLTDAIVDRED